MSETDELFASVNYIKHKVDTLEKIELLSLRSNKVLLDEYVAEFQADIVLLQVYKSIDGKRAQKDIAQILSTNEVAVSRKIKKLLELGLIEIKKVVGNNKIYMHSIAEKAFKLTKVL
ncbi:MAG: hypothetical protein QM657_03095 [Lacrimispora sp.]|uniref:hypothetical protein n=1 Tax=Lacrimispora sp. TaxID=2719234 RepID=UPI0039E2F9F7